MKTSWSYRHLYKTKWPRIAELIRVRSPFRCVAYTRQQAAMHCVLSQDASRKYLKAWSSPAWVLIGGYSYSRSEWREIRAGQRFYATHEAVTGGNRPRT